MPSDLWERRVEVRGDAMIPSKRFTSSKRANEKHPTKRTARIPLTVELPETWASPGDGCPFTFHPPLLVRCNMNLAARSVAPRC
jgi:hypothetical protein